MYIFESKTLDKKDLCTSLSSAACTPLNLGSNSRIKAVKVCCWASTDHLWSAILMTVFQFAEKFWQPDEPDRRTLGQGGASNGVER